MIKNIIYGVLILALIAYIAYSRGWIFANFKTISASESLQMIEQGAILLDVRTLAENKVEHIEDSILIPLHELEATISKLQAYKDKDIIVYCRSGNRSVSASRILASHGYRPYNMRGGIIEWNMSGYSVIKN